MLYIMRHGETDWNTLHKLQGRTDVPLNESGIAKAEAAREKYHDVHFDVCYCSPLSRAKMTAEILLEGREVPIIPDERLIEMSFGIYEGMEYSFDNPVYPVDVIFKSPERYTVPVEGGETLGDLFKRTGQFLDEVVKPLLEKGRDVLVVGHAGMNSSIICRLENIPIEKFWSARMDNCELKRLI